jgi:hypothetical protein
MELPTVQALESILAELRMLPDDDEDKASAIAKVQRQLDDLREKTAA